MRARAPWLRIIVVAALAATGACRERQVAPAPAVAPGDETTRAIAPVAIPLPLDELRAAQSSPALCSLDYIDDLHAEGILPVARAHPVRFRGWFGTAAREPAGDFELVLAGNDAAWASPMATGASRPDVADYFDALSMEMSGFDRTANLSAAAPGTYEIVLLMRESGATIACGTAKRIRLQ